MPLGGVASALRPSDFGGSSAVSLNEDEVMEKLRKRAQAHSYTGGGRDWERALRPATKNNSGVFALTNWYSLVRKTFKMTKQDISDELIRSVGYNMCQHVRGVGAVHWARRCFTLYAGRIVGVRCRRLHRVL